MHEVRTTSQSQVNENNVNYDKATLLVKDPKLFHKLLLLYANRDKYIYIYIYIYINISHSKLKMDEEG